MRPVGDEQPLGRGAVAVGALDRLVHRRRASTKPSSTMTSVSTRPEPPRRDGVVTPLPFLGRLAFGGAPVCAGGFMCWRWLLRPPASPVGEPSGRSSVRMTQRPGRPGSPVRRPRRLLVFLPLRGVACRRPGRPCPPRSFRHPSSSARRGSALNVASGSREPDRRAVDDDLGRLRALAPRARRAPRRARRRARACGSRPPRRPRRRRTSAHTAARAAPPAPSTSARAAGRVPAPRRARRAARARRCCRRGSRRRART